jgi:hypothetical protein
VIVFPLFAAGTVTVDSAAIPATEIHIGVTCPTDVTCLEDQPVTIEALPRVSTGEVRP